ncbi:phosphoglycerate mutase-like protein [Atractiella rhizophila]|nr:phosphoglycerate mutase-like protein [Atractiella rhizophila]
MDQLSKDDLREHESLSRPMPPPRRNQLCRYLLIPSVCLALFVYLILPTNRLLVPSRPSLTLHQPTRTAVAPVADAPFPSGTGFPGPTPTGIEPSLVNLAYPLQQDVFPLVRPRAKDSNASSTFDIAKHWGNLSPFYSVPQSFPGSESVENASPSIPHACKLKQVHILHRHGARYPTSYSGPENFALKLARHLPNLKTSGDLSFLPSWRYTLGAEILTPFGRNQLFQLGVGMRQKYGYMLSQGSEEERKGNKLVFRTTSQDRMLKSALNFAAGFWGIPFEEQYDQLAMIEAPGFNCTLAPYKTCGHATDRVSKLYERPLQEWIGIYLKDARNRLQSMTEGMEWTTQDVFDAQTVCPYEVVALGASSFCSIFTEEEWRGFDYAWDIYFWYATGHGAPTSAAVGIGWVQELVSRLTKEPIQTHNSSTNATYHTPQLFPLNQPIYVDATHDSVFPPILTALNFTLFSRGGPLPSTHIPPPEKRSYVTTRVAPFAANLQIQVMTCEDDANEQRDGREKEDVVRFILNDAVLPLEDIKGCASDEEGRCKLETVVSALKERIQEVDFAEDCFGDYRYDTNITTGRPEPR